MPKETKFTLALMLVIGTCFGVVVWQKMEHQKKLLAAMQPQPGQNHITAQGPGRGQERGSERGQKQAQGPGQGQPGASPFDQFPGNTTPRNATSGNTAPKGGEPRRLPVGQEQSEPGVNPFDQPQTVVTHKPAPAPDKMAQNGPAKDLFQPSNSKSAPVPGAPVPNPAAGSNPFDNFGGSQASQPPGKPNTSAPAPTPAQSPFDAFPAAQAQGNSPNPPRQGQAGFAPAPTPSPGAANPFDNPFNPAQPAGQTAQKPTQGGFPQGGQREPGQPIAQQNPFDAAGGKSPFPPQNSPVKPAVENSPGGGFNPFTPVQHSEEQPSTPPQGGFNPFDSMPLPQNPPKTEKPAPNPEVPSPFDSFPLDNAPGKPQEPGKPAPKPQPTPEPPKPANERPAPNPRDQPAPAPKFERPDSPRPETTRPSSPRPEAPRPEAPGHGFPADGRPIVIDPQKPVPVYTVQADETYWSISRKIYGTSRYFQALAEHNRHRVGDPKNLRPGMKILVPEAKSLDTLYAKILPGGNTSPEAGEVAEGLFYSNSGAPLYRVGKEDTLSDIALKHLGRSSRWVEIYQMNREVLKTPDRLRLGTVLKMPADASRLVYDDNPRMIR